MSAAAALALEQPRPMIVQSDILGPLTVAEEEIVSFPAGLFGLPECRSFVLLPAEREGLYWLQSVEHATLSFVLVDPFLHFPSYAVDVSPADLADLGTGDPAEVAILAIVTLPRTRGEEATANLQGPLALCLETRRGKQLAIQDAEHGVRAPLELMPR